MKTPNKNVHKNSPIWNCGLRKGYILCSLGGHNIDNYGLLDKKWFNETYPVLLDTWKKVCYYRDHLEELPPLQEIADKRKKFYRMNTELTMNNYDSDLAFMNFKDKPSRTNSKVTAKSLVLECNET